jgi:hypothetical protein
VSNQQFWSHTPARVLVLLGIDGLIFFSSLYYGVALRYTLGRPHEYAEVLPLLPRALAYTTIMLATFAVLGLYAQGAARLGKGNVIRLWLGVGAGAVLMFIAGHAAQRLFLGRASIALTAILTGLLAIAARYVVQRYLVERGTAPRSG